MIDNLQAEDIDATLKIGQIWTGKGLRIIFIILYTLLGIALVLMLTMIIAIPLTVGEYDSNSIAAIVGGSSMFIICSITFTCLLWFFRSRKKKVDLYLQDAVILKAKTKSIGEQVMVRGFTRGFIMLKAVAIEVEFAYNGKHYKKRSAYKEKPAYLPVFKKYINQTIMIAYSPKYDEVMFIKHTSIDRKQIGLK